MSRGAMPILIAVALTAVAAVVPLTSRAGHSDLRDADDARGPLDIRTVQVGSERPARWRVYTWDSWRATQIWDRGYVVVKFDTFGDSHFDYYALVGSDGYRLFADLYRDYARRGDRRIRSLDVGRPDRRSLRLTVPYGAMRFDQEYAYRWNVTSTWTANRCRSVCLDRAPNSGAVIEPGPLPTPTPTVTPTPTISPSPTATSP